MDANVEDRSDGLPGSNDIVRQLPDESEVSLR